MHSFSLITTQHGTSKEIANTLPRRTLRHCYQVNNISERVHDVSKSMSPSPEHGRLMLKEPNSPSATSQALRSWEWWAFFTSLSARIFSRARVRNMFFVFFPSYMSQRNLERGVARSQRRVGVGRGKGGWVGCSRLEMGDVFLWKCQLQSPFLTNINKYRRWRKSLSSPLTACLLRHVGERKRRHVCLKTDVRGERWRSPPSVS